VKITLNKLTSKADAGLDEDLYSLDKQDTLHAVKPLIGTGTWRVISGGATISADSIVKNLSTGLNEFEWKVVNGTCESTDQKIITVYEIKVPEGFSPNGDGINDEFEIQGLNTDQNEVTLHILNSAGTEVYFSTNASGGTWANWNGENTSGIIPEGTYYYILTIRSLLNSNALTTSGFVILKRYNSQ
jgi:gliding motility-associated-like protein